MHCSWICILKPCKQNHFADRGAIGNSLNYDPTHGPYDATSRYSGYTAWTIPAMAIPTPLSNKPHCLAGNKKRQCYGQSIHCQCKCRLSFWFLPDLRINLSVGHDQAKGEGRVIVPNTAAFAFDAINGGGVNNYYTQNQKNTVLNPTLIIKKRLW